MSTESKRERKPRKQKLKDAAELVNQALIAKGNEKVEARVVGNKLQIVRRKK